MGRSSSTKPEAKTPWRDRKAHPRTQVAMRAPTVASATATAGFRVEPSAAATPSLELAVQAVNYACRGECRACRCRARVAAWRTRRFGKASRAAPPQPLAVRGYCARQGPHRLPRANGCAPKARATSAALLAGARERSLVNPASVCASRRRHAATSISRIARTVRRPAAWCSTAKQGSATPAVCLLDRSVRASGAKGNWTANEG
jgi:hypothetical protein